MKIRLSDHFSYGRLLRFTLPSIVTMVIASLYSVVDGLFVSNLVGDMALSAVNIAFPIAMIIGAIGFMLGTGGSALVAKTLGEGNKELADRYFSMIIYTIMIVGGLLSVITVLLVEPIMWAAGASELLTVSAMEQFYLQEVFHLCFRPVSRIFLWSANGQCWDWCFPYCPGSPIWFWITYLLQFWAWGSLVQALLQ